MAFVDQYRDGFGVESICTVLQIAPSGYWRYAASRRNPALQSARARRDAADPRTSGGSGTLNLRVYGADKIWRQLQREGIAVSLAWWND